MTKQQACCGVQEKCAIRRSGKSEGWKRERSQIVSRHYHISVIILKGVGILGR